MIFHDSPSQSPENILFPTADFRRTFPLSTLADASAQVRSHAAAAQPVASSSTSSGVSAVALTMLGASAMAGARRKNQVKVYHLDVGGFRVGSEWVPPVSPCFGYCDTTEKFMNKPFQPLYTYNII